MKTILTSEVTEIIAAGTERVVGHFKKLTSHGASIIKFVHGNFEKLPVHKLKLLLELHIAV